MAAGTVKLSYTTTSNGVSSATVSVTMTYYGNGETYDGAPSSNNCWITLNGTTKYFTHSYTTSSSAQTMGSASFTINKTHATQSFTATGGITNYSSVYSNPTGSCTVSVSAKTSYTVSYNANGGSGAPSSQTKWYGETLTLSSTQPTRTGYTFAGWNTNSSGTGTNYSVGGSYTSNAALTLYAKWTPVTYTVTYNANGGTNAPASQTKTYGVDLTLSADIPTYSGYNFQGWSTTDTGGVEYNPSGTYKSNSAVTLYAVWTVAYTAPSISNAVAVRCDANGNEKLSGDYVKLSFSWNGGLEADGTINPATITVTGDATYSESKTGIFSGDITLNQVALPIDQTGSAIITVTDTAKSTSATQEVGFPLGGIPVHISKNENAIAFFGIAPEEYPDVNYGLFSGKNYSVEKNDGWTGYVAKRSDTGTGVSLEVGSAGVNHGVYSHGLGRWLLYADEDGIVHLNGSPLRVYNDGSIRMQGGNVAWIKGRDSAIVRLDSPDGYSAIISQKTPLGSWELGNYAESTSATTKEAFVFTYASDANYESYNNTVVQPLMLTADGDVYFKGSVMADFVIQQSTSGNWTYRKWYSGVAECWGNFTISTSSWSAWGNLYEGGHTSVTYPSGLFNAVPVTNITVNYSNNGVCGLEYYQNGSKTTTGTIYVLRPNTVSGTTTTVIAINAKGRWK